MESPSEMQLSKQVEQCLDRLCRWTRVIRHDLGNILYPSARLRQRIEADSTNGDVNRYVRQVSALVETVDESRASLNNLRTRSDSDDAQTTTIADWWTRFGRLASSLIASNPRIDFEPASDSLQCAVPPRDLTLLVMSALITVDIQIESDESTTACLVVQRSEDQTKIRCRFDFKNVDCEVLVVPESVERRADILAAQVRAGVANDHSCWLSLDLPAA